MKKQNVCRLGLSKGFLGLCLSMMLLNYQTTQASSLNESSVVVKQQIMVRGQVVDNKGVPLPGVSVLVKGKTGKGVATDFDGNYSIEVSTNDVLVFSYVGFATQEISVKGKSTINVTLKEDAQELGEVVVVGFGTKKKVNLTGAVASVKVDEVTEGRPINNLASGLSGAVSGLSIGAQGGPAGGTPKMTIRGVGTLGAGTGPLIVVDGTVAGGFAGINPEDIESVSVLKDAASASIYGSRAANGVILVTTKKGKQGKVKLNLNSHVSFTSVGDLNAITPVSNYADYMELINEGYRNSGQNAVYSDQKILEWRNAGDSDPLKYPNVDWRKVAFRESLGTNYSLSASGGSDKTTFFTSFRYTKDLGVIENSGLNRATFRINLETKALDWLILGTKVSTSLRSLDQGVGLVDNMFNYGMATSPGMVMRSPDGRYGSPNNSQEENPSVGSNNFLMRLNERDGETNIYDAVYNFYGILAPLKGLNIRGSFTYDGTLRKDWYKPVYLDRWDFYNDSYLEPVGSGQTMITKELRESTRQYMDLVATYDVNLFEKLDMTAMIGATQEKYTSYSDKSSKKDLIDPSLTIPNAAIGEASFSGSKFQWTMHSLFSRLNFNWDNKYLLELNLRRDGSSRFSRENRFGYFPSASIGWRIDQQDFLKKFDKIDMLKLRLSYGALGNNEVGNYEYISKYNKSLYVLNNQLQNGWSIRAIPNESLSWEKTYVANIGVDFAFLRNRLTGSIDVFDKTSVDILIDLPAPPVHGTASIPKQNSAKVRNRGFEIELSWQDKIKDFSYYIKANMSYIKNKVLKFKGDIPAISGGRILQEGLPIRPAYVLEYDRIIQTAEDMKLVEDMIRKNPDAFRTYGKPEMGDILYKDLDGNNAIDDNDRRVFEEAGSSYPILSGLTLGAQYKGIDFSVTAQGNLGLLGYYQNKAFTTNVEYGTQLNKEITDGRWYNGRTDASYPRLTNGRNINTLNSNFWFSDRSFVRIKNIQLGYTLPKEVSEKIHISRMRLYTSFENFFTFTSWKGIDPEFTGLGYPSMKQSLLGINLSF